MRTRWLGVIASVLLVPSMATAQRAATAVASGAYIVAALYGAHVAIRDSLAEAPLGVHSHRSVRDEFFTGTGTGLSPGLPMLVAQGIATAYVAGSRRSAQRAGAVLAVGGVLYELGQLSEPITYRTLGDLHDAPREHVASVVLNLLIPPVMTVAAARLHRH